KSQRNKAGDQIGTLKKKGEDAAALVQEMAQVSERIKQLDEQVKLANEELREILLALPNVPHESVPVGRSAVDNMEVRRWGTPREFVFKPKAHWEIGEQLGILDMERGAKLSGARFAVYWDLGARLE